jgi:hypothetical protein
MASENGYIELFGPLKEDQLTSDEAYAYRIFNTNVRNRIITWMKHWEGPYGRRWTTNKEMLRQEWVLYLAPETGLVTRYCIIYPMRLKKLVDDQSS